jgi:putative membrane protein
VVQAEARDGARADAADGQWHRVHPLTPAVRSWQVLAVLLVVFAQESGRNALSGEGFPEPDGFPDSKGLLLTGGGIALGVVLLVAVGLAVLSWRFTRYRVTADALELHHGILVRRQRQARLDRLQAVDVVQPLVARIFGLARLTLEVAGGGDSRVELSYLTDTQARRLRNHLLARAAGVRYDTEEAPEAPEHHVLEVPVPRLIGALVLSGTTAFLVLFVLGLVVSAALTGQVVAFAGLFPALLGTGGLLWRRFSGGFGFTVTTSPDGLRLRHGLLEHRAQTVPPGRVQAVRLAQPLLWRGRDWWKVTVNVAGYGRGGERAEDTETALLPVGTRDDAVTVLALVLPDLGVAPPEHPRAVVEAGLTGRDGDGGFAGPPRAARWVDPLVWRRTGFRVTGEALLLRSGRLHRGLDVVPHARTQSVGLRQGPLDRRLGLVTFVLHSTPGSITPTVPHLPPDLAAALLQGQAVRARRARLRAGPERWMEQVAPAPVSPAAPGAASGAAAPGDPLPQG